VADFEVLLNRILVETFNNILKFEGEALRKLSSDPVTVAEAHLLEAIAQQPDGITVGQLAGRAGITAPTATVAVKKLEKKGLVAKTSSPDDARSSLISLTKRGKAIDRAHQMFHKNMVNTIAEAFAEEEKAVLLKAIAQLNDFFRVRTAH